MMGGIRVHRIGCGSGSEDSHCIPGTGRCGIRDEFSNVQLEIGRKGHYQNNTNHHHQPPPPPKGASDIQVLHIEGVVFDEFATRLRIFAHKRGKDGFGLGKIF